MSTEAVSPLRRRMIENMTMQQFGEHTQRDYTSVRSESLRFFSAVHPDCAEPKDVRRYPLNSTQRRHVLGQCVDEYAHLR